MEENLKWLRRKGDFQFIIDDVRDQEFAPTDIFLINYVLQFLDETSRLALLKKIYKALIPGGILILSEKTKPEDESINSAFVTNHEAFKIKNHYSHLEIAQKRKALENVLIPYSLTQNMKLLENAGFLKAETFMVWHNFASILAVKS